jgi:CubicO group peptidase (beta-lactamase class C family)
MIRSSLLLCLLLFDGTRADRHQLSDPGGARELAGLWQARQRFGPDIRGPLVLRHIDEGWWAEIAGRRSSAHWRGDNVTFQLAEGDGAFRGHWSGDRQRIEGYWIQPATVNTGARLSSEVELRNRGSGKAQKQGGEGHNDGEWWGGEVKPLDDVLTFYLKVDPRPDGSMGAFIRNPERNLGRFLKVDHLEREGETIRLLSRGDSGSSGEVVLAGSYRDSTITIAIPGRGGSYDFRRVSPDSTTDFYPRGRPTVPYHYMVPLATGDGWPTGTPEQVGLSRDTLERFIQMLSDTRMDSLSVPEIHGVLIARHGRLVLEEYFHGADRDQPHDTRSASKSLTSVLIGAAIQSGVPLTPTSPVYRVMNGGSFPAGLDPRKSALTLQHLLNMSSGLDCDDSDPESPGNEDRIWQQTEQPDWYRFILDLKNIRDPGAQAVYCSINPHLAGGVLARAAGRPLPDLFHDLVAEPLGIRQYYFNLTPSGDAYMGGGARLLPRDFMKLGQLMLNGGTWKGKRILSRDWVQRSTRPRYDIGKLKYGYLWWMTQYPFGADSLPAFFAAGNGGQYVIVVPKLDLVAAFYGGNYNDAPGRTSQQEYMPRWVMKAVGGG